MSAPAWRPPAPVIDQLLLAPQGFGFFQAVRLLERWLGVEAGGGLDRIHFRTSLSMGFPASEIESLQAHWSHSDLVKLPAHLERIDLTPACMGLLGVSGALPLFYTELVSQAETQGRNRSARAFLEVFSHRSVTLFYQAWRKHRLAVQFESDRRRAFLPQVLALGGLGLRGLRERMSAPEGGVADEGLAYFAAALQQRTPGTAASEAPAAPPRHPRGSRAVRGAVVPRAGCRANPPGHFRCAGAHGAGGRAGLATQPPHAAHAGAPRCGALRALPARWGGGAGVASMARAVVWACARIRDPPELAP